MLRQIVAIASAIVIAFMGYPRPFGSSNEKPADVVWKITVTLRSGTKIPLHFQTEVTDGGAQGPRLILPCIGQAEVATMQGWRDDSLRPMEYSWDSKMRGEIKSEFKIGGDSASEGLLALRREQTKIETELTKALQVKPGEGNGPRPNEEVYRFDYKRVHLTVRIGGSSYSHRLSTFYVPYEKPYLETSRPCGSDPKETACSMEGFGFQSGASPKSQPLPPADKTPTGYIGAVYEAGVAEQIANSEFAVTGVDINEVSVQPPKFSQAPNLKWILLPTGTVLVPGKEGIQAMITVDPLLLKAGQVDDLTQLELSSGSVAVHCLELEKSPPNSTIKFSIGRASDPVLRNLAMATQRSAIKGPWDQARIWVYTDRAPLEKINKRLALGCPPGMYVRSLWEVQLAGGLTDKDLANPDLFKPEYLGGVCNRKEAMAWFTGVLATHHSEVLANYLSSGGKELAGLIESSNPLAQGQFTKITTQLMVHSMPKIRLAILQFLDSHDATALKKAIGKPAPQWERFVEEEGLEGELGKKLQNKWN